MDQAAILQLLDSERQTVADPDVRLEKTPYVVRALGLESSGNGIVYSHFAASQTDGIINAEIHYFFQLHRAFEWKVYSHDTPRDLLEHLSGRGFKIGQEESLMVRDLKPLPASLKAPPPNVIVSRVRDERMVGDYLRVEAAVWPGEPSNTRDFLRLTLSGPLNLNPAFVAYLNGVPVGCARATASANSAFAGLWGGSVVPDFRRQGIYRALLSARIHHIMKFSSIRFLRVDAMPMSRPILEKYGFMRLASTWPAEWGEGSCQSSCQCQLPVVSGE